MRQLFFRFARAIEVQAEWTGRAVAWLIPLMVLMTFVIVMLRYGLDLGWIALQESVGYLHMLVFMLGMAHTLNHDGHVRVDVFYNRLSARSRAWVDLTGSLLLLLPVSLYIFVSSWDYVVDSWRVLESSREAGGLGGVFVMKTLIPIMSAQLTLQGIARIVRNLEQLLAVPGAVRRG